MKTVLSMYKSSFQSFPLWYELHGEPVAHGKVCASPPSWLSQAWRRGWVQKLSWLLHSQMALGPLLLADFDFDTLSRGDQALAPAFAPLFLQRFLPSISALLEVYSIPTLSVGVPLPFQTLLDRTLVHRKNSRGLWTSPDARADPTSALSGLSQSTLAFLDMSHLFLLFKKNIKIFKWFCWSSLSIIEWGTEQSNLNPSHLLQRKNVMTSFSKELLNAVSFPLLVLSSPTTWVRVKCLNMHQFSVCCLSLLTT